MAAAWFSLQISIYANVDRQPTISTRILLNCMKRKNRYFIGSRCIHWAQDHWEFDTDFITPFHIDFIFLAWWIYAKVILINFLRWENKTNASHLFKKKTPRGTKLLSLFSAWMSLSKWALGQLCIDFEVIADISIILIEIPMWPFKTCIDYHFIRKTRNLTFEIESGFSKPKGNYK